jgi:intron-binding protein aquarius
LPTNWDIDIILSLVRTRSIGYLRSIRRLTVALSRARLGLYILGRRSVFESVFELKPAFDILLQRSDKLALVTNEMFAETQRPVSSNADALEGEAVMQDVEHLGKYVYEMTKAKVEALRMNGGVLPTREVDMGDVQGEDEDDREENVLVPEEMAEGGFEDEEEDEDVKGGI